MLPTKWDIVCVFVAVIQVSLLLATVARSSLSLVFRFDKRTTEAQTTDLTAMVSSKFPFF